jgi:hypothetical protein
MPARCRQALRVPPFESAAQNQGWGLPKLPIGLFPWTRATLKGAAILKCRKILHPATERFAPGG